MREHTEERLAIADELRAFSAHLMRSAKAATDARHKQSAESKMEAPVLAEAEETEFTEDQLRQQRPGDAKATEADSTPLEPASVPFHASPIDPDTLHTFSYEHGAAATLLQARARGNADRARAARLRQELEAKLGRPPNKLELAEATIEGLRLRLAEAEAAQAAAAEAAAQAAAKALLQPRNRGRRWQQSGLVDIPALTKQLTTPQMAHNPTSPAINVMTLKIGAASERWVGRVRTAEEKAAAAERAAAADVEFRAAAQKAAEEKGVAEKAAAEKAAAEKAAEVEKAAAEKAAEMLAAEKAAKALTKQLTKACMDQTTSTTDLEQEPPPTPRLLRSPSPRMPSSTAAVERVISPTHLLRFVTGSPTPLLRFVNGSPAACAALLPEASTARLAGSSLAAKVRGAEGVWAFTAVSTAEDVWAGAAGATPRLARSLQEPIRQVEASTVARCVSAAAHAHSLRGRHSNQPTNESITHAKAVVQALHLRPGTTLSRPTSRGRMPSRHKWTAAQGQWAAVSALSASFPGSEAAAKHAGFRLPTASASFLSAARSFNSG
jgi:hypothetical protein